MFGYEDRKVARARALRAARVVTLGLAIASTPACGSEPMGIADSGARDSGTGRDAAAPEDGGPVPVDGGDPRDAGRDAALADAAPIDAAPADAAPADAAPADAALADAAPIDAGAGDGGEVVADAGCIAFPPTTQECCELAPGGYWDPGSMMCFVAVQGPFVPPAMA